ncbi:hypothetical protein GQ600_21506 [Phytophthora cactorum]|nr:hypothetical protein GQ600_21506 [Phytophthora cactorum]
MTIDHVMQPGEDSVLVARLARSRAAREHQQKPDAHSEIAHVVAQLHGHVTVDSNLLTLPVVQLERRLSEDEKMGAELPDVRNFSGDTGTCIFRSAPSVLLSDINIAPTQSELEAAAAKPHGAIDPVSAAEAAREETAERCTREFAIALPGNICPTFRGSSARVFYVVSITAQCAIAGSKPVSVHLPFEDKGDGSTASGNKSAETTPNKQQAVGGTTRVGRQDRSLSLAPAPVGVRTGSEIAFELRPSLMHGRVETEQMQRAQTSIFTLARTFYQPGEVLLGVFDFARASIPCFEVSATLCLEETLSTMALDPDRVVQSKVFSSFHERTLGVLQANWLLRFEFSAGASPQKGSGADPTQQQRQTFQWQVPIVVQPAVATERNQLANVPHKLYSGSTRVASLTS